MNAPLIDSLQIQNYRSIGQPILIKFPSRGPLVLLGENNAGKSNITRALDLLFGERWPGTYQPEDHDFHGRNPDQVAIKIGARPSGLMCPYCSYGDVSYIRWGFDKAEADEPQYSMTCTDCTRSFMKRELREQLFCMFIGADRNLNYQLSYSSKYTFLSKLMHRFHRALVNDETRRAKLTSIFSDILGEFGGVEEFNAFRRTLGSMTSELSGSLSYRLDIDFSAYDPSNFFRSLRVYPHFGNDARTFDELGSGQAEILAMAFAYAYAEAFGRQSGLILVIDEPESHLHPLAQQWLANKLNELVTDGLQVVVATHSPHFVDLARPENLVLVHRDDASAPTTARQVTRPKLVDELKKLGAPARITTESVGDFYASGATDEIRSGIFAKAAVLVEGPTEAYALPELLRLVGFDPLRCGIAFVNVAGASSLAKWHRFYTIFGIPTYMVFDTDSDKHGSDAESCRRVRLDVMKALGYPDNRADEMAPNCLDIQERYATLSPNFEGAIEALLGDRWTDLTAKAAEVIGSGSSKPLIARYAAQHLDPHSLPTAAKEQLKALAERLSKMALDT